MQEVDSKSSTLSAADNEIIATKLAEFSKTLTESFTKLQEEIKKKPSVKAKPLADAVMVDVEHFATIVNVSKTVSGDKSNVYDRVFTIASQVDDGLQKLLNEVYYGDCNSEAFRKCCEIMSGIFLLQTTIKSKTPSGKHSRSPSEAIVEHLEQQVENLKPLSQEIGDHETIKETLNDIKEGLNKLSQDSSLTSCESIIQDALQSCNQLTDIVEEEVKGRELKPEPIIRCTAEDVPVIKSVITTISNMNSHLLKSSFGLDSGEPIGDINVEKIPMAQFLNNFETSVMTLGESIMSKMATATEVPVDEKDILDSVSKMVSLVNEIRLQISGDDEVPLIVLPLLNKLDETTSAIESSLLNLNEGDKSFNLSSQLQNFMTPLRVLHNFVQQDIDPEQSIKEAKSQGIITEMSMSICETINEKLINQFAKASADLDDEISKIEDSLRQPSKKRVKITEVASLLKPLAVLTSCVQSLNETNFESATAMEKSNMSILMSLAQPVQEIEQAVAKIQEQVAFESSGSLTAVKGVELLQAVAAPVRELRANVALVQEQANVLTANESITDLSYHVTVAKELIDLKEAVTNMLQSGLIDCKSLAVDDVSKIKAIAKPLQELNHQLVNINTQEILEAEASTFSVKEIINQIAHPVYELQKGLAFIEEQEVLLDVGQRGDKSVLETIAKPLFEVCKHVVEVIENKLMEGVDSEENTIHSDLPTLASLSEMGPDDKGFAVVEERVVYQDAGVERKEVKIPSRESGIDLSNKEGDSPSLSDKSLTQESGIGGPKAKEVTKANAEASKIEEESTDTLGKEKSSQIKTKQSAVTVVSSESESVDEISSDKMHLTRATESSQELLQKATVTETKVEKSVETKSATESQVTEKTGSVQDIEKSKTESEKAKTSEISATSLESATVAPAVDVKQDASEKKQKDEKVKKKEVKEEKQEDKKEGKIKKQKSDEKPKSATDKETVQEEKSTEKTEKTLLKKKSEEQIEIKEEKKESKEKTEKKEAKKEVKDKKSTEIKEEKVEKLEQETAQEINQSKVSKEMAKETTATEDKLEEAKVTKTEIEEGKKVKEEKEKDTTQQEKLDKKKAKNDEKDGKLEKSKKEEPVLAIKTAVEQVEEIKDSSLKELLIEESAPDQALAKRPVSERMALETYEIHEHDKEMSLAIPKHNVLKAKVSSADELANAEALAVDVLKHDVQPRPMSMISEEESDVSKASSARKDKEDTDEAKKQGNAKIEMDTKKEKDEPKLKDKKEETKEKKEQSIEQAKKAEQEAKKAEEKKEAFDEKQAKELKEKETVSEKKETEVKTKDKGATEEKGAKSKEKEKVKASDKKEAEVKSKENEKDKTQEKKEVKSAEKVQDKASEKKETDVKPKEGEKDKTQEKKEVKSEEKLNDKDSEKKETEVKSKEGEKDKTQEKKEVKSKETVKDRDSEKKETDVKPKEGAKDKIREKKEVKSEEKGKDKDLEKEETKVTSKEKESDKSAEKKEVKVEKAKDVAQEKKEKEGDSKKDKEKKEAKPSEPTVEEKTDKAEVKSKKLDDKGKDQRKDSVDTKATAEKTDASKTDETKKVQKTTETTEKKEEKATVKLEESKNEKTEIAADKKKTEAKKDEKAKEIKKEESSEKQITEKTDKKDIKDKPQKKDAKGVEPKVELSEKQKPSEKSKDTKELDKTVEEKEKNALQKSEQKVESIENKESTKDKKEEKESTDKSKVEQTPRKDSVKDESKKIKETSTDEKKTKKTSIDQTVNGEPKVIEHSKVKETEKTSETKEKAKTGDQEIEKTKSVEEKKDVKKKASPKKKKTESSDEPKKALDKTETKEDSATKKTKSEQIIVRETKNEKQVEKSEVSKGEMAKASKSKSPELIKPGKRKEKSPELTNGASTHISRRPLDLEETDAKMDDGEVKEIKRWDIDSKYIDNGSVTSQRIKKVPKATETENEYTKFKSTSTLDIRQRDSEYSRNIGGRSESYRGLDGDLRKEDYSSSLTSLASPQIRKAYSGEVSSPERLRGRLQHAESLYDVTPRTHHLAKSRLDSRLDALSSIRGELPSYTPRYASAMHLGPISSPTRKFSKSFEHILAPEDRDDSPRRGRENKPTFSVRLMDRTVVQGSTVKLTCSVIGNPEPQVDWLKDGIPVADSLYNRFRSKVSNGVATLEITKVTSGDAGAYTCVAKNKNGQSSTSSALRVFSDYEPSPAAPVFVRSIKDSYNFRDDKVVMECKVQCQPAPSVSWFKDGHPLSVDPRCQQSENYDGTCSLTINHPETSDSGNYTCKATTSFASEQVSHYFFFAGRQEYTPAKERRFRDPRKPSITNMLVDRHVPSGATLALQVQVSGCPRPEVTWMRGGEVVDTRSGKVQHLQDNDVHTLIVSDATPEESGVYTCRVSNKHGSEDSTATIEVVADSSTRGGKPPSILNKPPSTMTISVGEDLTFAFHVAGEPKPQVTWSKGIHDLSNSGRTLKESFGNYFRLTLKRATAYDAGTYFLIAKNLYGTDRAFITVKVRERARSLTPTTSCEESETNRILREIHDSVQSCHREAPGECGEAEVVDVGRNWVTLSWGRADPRGGGPILAYKVEAWSTDNGARWQELGRTTANSLDVFNLKPGSVYKFRVTARNRYGWGESTVTKEGVAIGTEARMPEFTKELPGQIKTLVGYSVNLECSVEGEPQPEVEWYKDGSLVENGRGVNVSRAGDVCRLELEEATPESEGRYVCQASNRAGRVSSFARLLVVTDPKLLAADSNLKRRLSEGNAEMGPVFTMRLRDRRVQMTYPVRLTCQVAGHPEPSVQWMKNNQPVCLDQSHLSTKEGSFHTLEITRAMLEDGGEYSAVAANSLGSVACRAVLTVDKGIRAYVTPEFTRDLPSSTTVEEGGELVLNTHVEAYPSVGITWYRDGVRVRPSRHTTMTLSPEGEAELRMGEMTSRCFGTYTCVASNTVGRAETSCQVLPTTTLERNIEDEAPPARTRTLQPYSKAPIFVTKPRSTEAVEGDTVVILCEVVGDPKPEVVWLRDWLKPEYYRDGDRFRRVGEGPAFRLEIEKVKLDHTGAYSVVATNTHGEAKAVISLQVYAKGQGKGTGEEMGSIREGRVERIPEVVCPLRDMRCCDGDAVTMECAVRGAPPPDIRWEKDGKILPLSTSEDMTAMEEGERAILRIAKVYPEDEGEYTCVAFNKLGKATTSACLVVDVAEEKEWLVAGDLNRPSGLKSAGSTPRSTPRSTPARSPSPAVTRSGPREWTGFETRQRTKVAPRFYSVPHDRVAEEGETVRLTCSARGVPSPWTTWTRDGRPVAPSARISVTERDDLRVVEIRAVTKEDAGLYRVALENDYGRVEASARLDVIGRRGVGAQNGDSKAVRAWSGGASPSFDRRLSGSTSRPGADFTFSCDVQSNPNPVISWYRNGELLVQSERLIPTWDGRTARLELCGLEESDTGVYTCVAENRAGRTRCSAELVVAGPPQETQLRPPVFVTGLTETTSATEGRPVELQVVLQGDEPMDVVWVKDGVEIPDCHDFRYVAYGNGRYGLRIADPFVADSGTYNCEVFSDHGEAVSSTTLKILDKGSTDGGMDTNLNRLYFTKAPTPVIVAAGNSTKFCVKVHTPAPEPSPLFMWEIGGNPVSSTNQRFYVISRGDESVLELRRVEETDSSEVFCSVRWCPKCPTSKCPIKSPCRVCHIIRTGAVLRVTPGPKEDSPAPARILSGPADTTALAGDRIILQATFSGHPRPNVRWLKQGRVMATDRRVRVDTGTGVTCLVIQPVLPDDSAKYVLTVENNLGSDCAFASLAVEGRPEPVKAVPSVGQTGPGAVCVAWSGPPYDGGSKVTGYLVEMCQDQSDQWQVLTNSCLCLCYTKKELEEGQSYRFRVCALNIHGASDPSPASAPIHIGPFETAADEESIDISEERASVSVERGDQFRDDFLVAEELGKGRYGIVHKVIHRSSQRTLAAKFVRCIKKQDREKVYQEIEIMNCLRHPKLLQLTAAFENHKEIIMVMEYISGGELFERVVADDFTLTEKDCILFMRQICEGVGYMHRNNVVHLDLKPENIMCQSRTSHQIKLIDFGLAQRLRPGTPIRVLWGTPEFIPPEIINYEPIGTESDMWSVGVICYVLLSGLSPFMGDNDAETFANITRADYDFDDEAFNSISQDAKDFISSLLVKRKEKRMSAGDCLMHKWLSQEDVSMSKIALSTDKLKKFLIHRKWQTKCRRIGN